jgi:hypothetical protein
MQKPNRTNLKLNPEEFRKLGFGLGLGIGIGLGVADGR